MFPVNIPLHSYVLDLKIKEFNNLVGEIQSRGGGEVRNRLLRVICRGWLQVLKNQRRKTPSLKEGGWDDLIKSRDI